MGIGRVAFFDSHDQSNLVKPRTGLKPQISRFTDRKKMVKYFHITLTGQAYRNKKAQSVVLILCHPCHLWPNSGVKPGQTKNRIKATDFTDFTDRKKMVKYIHITLIRPKHIGIKASQVVLILCHQCHLWPNSGVKPGQTKNPDLKLETQFEKCTGWAVQSATPGGSKIVFGVSGQARSRKVRICEIKRAGGGLRASSSRPRRSKVLSPRLPGQERLSRFLASLRCWCPVASRMWTGGQTIQERPSQPLTAQHLGPLLKGQVGRQDQAGGARKPGSPRGTTTRLPLWRNGTSPVRPTGSSPGRPLFQQGVAMSVPRALQQLSHQGPSWCRSAPVLPWLQAAKPSAVAR